MFEYILLLFDLFFISFKSCQTIILTKPKISTTKTKSWKTRKLQHLSLKWKLERVLKTWISVKSKAQAFPCVQSDSFHGQYWQTDQRSCRFECTGTSIYLSERQYNETKRDDKRKAEIPFSARPSALPLKPNACKEVAYNNFRCRELPSIPTHPRNLTVYKQWSVPVHL